MAELITATHTPLNLSLKLTSDMKKALGSLLDELPVVKDNSLTPTLRFNPNEEDEDDDDEIPF